MNSNILSVKTLFAAGIFAIAGLGSIAHAQNVEPVTAQQAAVMTQLSSAIGAAPDAIKNAPVQGVVFKLNGSGVECLVDTRKAPDLNTLYQQNQNVARCMVGLIGAQDIADSVKQLAQTHGPAAKELMEKGISQAVSEVGGSAGQLMQGVGMFLTAVAAGNDPALADWAKQVAQKEQDPGSKAVLERVSSFIQAKSSLGSEVKFDSFNYVLGNMTEIAMKQAIEKPSIQDTMVYR